MLFAIDPGIAAIWVGIAAAVPGIAALWAARQQRLSSDDRSASAEANARDGASWLRMEASIERLERDLAAVTAHAERCDIALAATRSEVAQLRNRIDRGGTPQ